MMIYCLISVLYDLIIRGCTTHKSPLCPVLTAIYPNSPFFSFFRRRTMFRRLYSDGSKSIASFPTASSSQPQTYPPRLDQMTPQKTLFSHFSKSSNIGNNTASITANGGSGMEMTENCHVYANPSYPGHSEVGTIQIGGLPFYLPQQHHEESSADSPSKQQPHHISSVPDSLFILLTHFWW